MNSRETDEFLRARNEDLARSLLFEAMPKMQPSALKHEYLTSVTNVMLHSVAKIRDPQDPTVGHSIGWGDKFRRLPLVLIEDLEDPPSVRHAFVPNPKNDIDAKLLGALQQQENSFAARHELKPRNIAKQIAFKGRNEVNRVGISFIHDEELTMPMIRELSRGVWYDTDFMRPADEISHDGRPDLSDPRDAKKIERNLTRSVDFSLASKDVDTRSVKARTHPKRNTLFLSDAEFVESFEKTTPEDFEMG